jgi:hypothetical protein
VGRTAEGWKLWQDGKTGRYSVRFRHEGARRSIALGTRDAGEAARKAPDVYADYVSGRWRPAVGVGARPQALDELVALWLDDYRAGRPGKTADAYELQWSTHLGPHFEWDFARLTRANFKAYQTKRLGEVTRSTLTKELSALNVFLEWLVETERIDEEAKPIIPKMPRGADSGQERISQVKGQDLYEAWGRGDGTHEQKKAWEAWEGTKVPYQSSLKNYCIAKTDLETAERLFPDNILQNLCYRAVRVAEAAWRTEAARVEAAWNGLERLERLAREVGVCGHVGLAGGGQLAEVDPADDGTPAGDAPAGGGALERPALDAIDRAPPRPLPAVDP